MNGTNFEEKEIFMFNLMNQLNKDNSSFIFSWNTVIIALHYMLSKPNYSEPKFLVRSINKDNKDIMISEIKTSLNNLGLIGLDVEVNGSSTIEIKDKEDNLMGYPLIILDNTTLFSLVYQSSLKDFSFRGEIFNDVLKREIYCLSHAIGEYSRDIQDLLHLYELSSLWNGDIDTLTRSWDASYGDFKLFRMKYTQLHEEYFKTLELDKTFDEVYDKVYNFLNPLLPSNKVVFWDGSKWSEI